MPIFHSRSGDEQPQRHRHVDACYTSSRTCGYVAEHSHSGRCYHSDKSKYAGQLKCVLDEHTHSKNCNSVQGPICGYLP